MQILIAYYLPTYLPVSTKELTLRLALQRTKKVKLKKTFSNRQGSEVSQVQIVGVGGKWLQMHWSRGHPDGWIHKAQELPGQKLGERLGSEPLLVQGES